MSIKIVHNFDGKIVKTVSNEFDYVSDAVALALIWQGYTRPGVDESNITEIEADFGTPANEWTVDWVSKMLDGWDGCDVMKATRVLSDGTEYVIYKNKNYKGE